MLRLESTKPSSAVSSCRRCAGEWYIVACPRAASPFDDAEQAADYPALYTLQMVALADRLQRVAAGHHLLGAPARLRVGIHCGSAAGAVVGAVRAFYCLYGDAVNTAARMCKYAGVSAHVSADFAAAVAAAQAGLVRCSSRGVREIKGKGPMETFDVEVLDGFAASVQLRTQYAAAGGDTASMGATRQAVTSLGEWLRGGGSGSAAKLLEADCLSPDGRMYVEDRAHRIDPARKVFRDPEFERKFRVQTAGARRAAAVAAVLLHLLALGVQWHEVLQPEYSYPFGGSDPTSVGLRNGRAQVATALSYHFLASGLCSLALLVAACAGRGAMPAGTAWCSSFVAVKLTHLGVSLACEAWFPGDGWLLTFPVHVLSTHLLRHCFLEGCLLCEAGVLCPLDTDHVSSH